MSMWPKMGKGGRGGGVLCLLYYAHVFAFIHLLCIYLKKKCDSVLATRRDENSNGVMIYTSKV